MKRITKILVLLLFVSVIFFTTACTIDDIKGSISDIIGGGDSNIDGDNNKETNPDNESVIIILYYDNGDKMGGSF